MFKNYIMTAWRNIIKNGMFSVINIAGLAIGLMSCILIMLFVRSESGYDQWVPDHERIVRMHTGYYDSGRPPFLALTSAGRMMPALRDYARAEIETGVRLIPYGTTIQKGGDAFRETVVMADPSMFDVFKLPFLHGSVGQSYNKPMDLIISEAMAMKYFGRTDVVGETLTFCCQDSETNDLAITGVIKNIPEASHFEIDLLVYLEPAVFANSPNILETWGSVNVFTYFKMNEGVRLEQLQERINYWLDKESVFEQRRREMAKKEGKEIEANSKTSDNLKLRVMPLADLHLKAKQHSGSMGDWKALGDINMIYTFVAVAILVLLIACINFMNLATARASQRAREVAMRKVMGASKGQVALQFLSEALAIAFIAMLFSLAAVEAALPMYNVALGTELQLNLLTDFDLLAALISITFVVGVGAGLYPALYLSQFLPARILQASKGAGGSGSAHLRNALVIFQFAISITLAVSTAVVYGQTLFVGNMDVGFQSEGKMVLNVRRAGDGRRALQQELAKIPDVTGVALSSEAPTQDYENNNYFKLLERQVEGSNDQGLVINYHNMGYGFFDDYGVKPIAGRLFDRAYGTDEAKPIEEEGTIGVGGAILNLSAVQKFGFATAEEAIGKTLRSRVYRGSQHDLKIVGVIPDLYFRSLKYGVRATVYTLNPSRFRVASISYKTNDIEGLSNKIEEVWKKNVPLQPMNLQHLDEMMAAQYADESAQAKLFAAFAGLAIFIACLGLYGLASFTAERRTREIGIRKVLGAKVMDIIRLLVWQFSKPVLVANLIAWPTAWYFMSDWLLGFQYRLDNDFILMAALIAGALAMVIAWATVAGHAWRVARENPINALRYE